MQTDITLEVDVQATDVVTNLLTLYTNPWLVMSIVITFGVGMLTYLSLKAYKPQCFWVTNLLIITAVECIFGYAATWVLVQHQEVNRYALITGPNAAILYWVLDFVSARFKLVRVNAFLHLKSVRKNSEGHDEIGEPLFKIRKGK